MVLPGAQGRGEGDQGQRRVLEGRRGLGIAVSRLGPVDRLRLRRACELAARGAGGTSPNPAVGAVVVAGGRTVGEGWHRRRGESHAEVEALRDAASRGADVRGATMYVTLEPCDHQGLTPPCSRAVVAAGIARVVVGRLDPNPRTAGGGIARLRAAGIETLVAHDPWSRALVEDFAAAVRSGRPYVHLKLAASLDGAAAPRPGERYWLTGDAAREHVRELRARYDAVMVGAGTVRVDDPRLTLRPPRSRRTPYRRVVACEDAPVALDRAVLRAEPGYARTIVLAPAGRRDRFAALEAAADVLYVGAPDAVRLDLPAAMTALREAGVASVLCEGGPTLAGALLAADLVHRVDWIVAPTLLASPGAVRALGPGPVGTEMCFERVERLGADVLLSARIGGATCSAD